MRGIDTVIRVKRGYGRLFSGLVRIVVVMVCMAAITFGIVFPLWWIATRFPEIYTAAILIALASGVTVLLWHRNSRRIRSRQTATAKRKRSVSFGRPLMFLAILAIGYLLSLLIQSALWLPAAIAAIPLLLLIGLFAAGRNE